MTVSKVGCEVMWMRYVLGEFGYDTSRPSPILVDNASAIQVARHPEHQSTMKHVHRAYHWIRDHVERGDMMVTHVPGSENPADIFTKPLGRVKFAKFRAMLGLCGSSRVLFRFRIVFMTVPFVRLCVVLCCVFCCV